MSEIVDAAARDTAAPVSFATQVLRRTFARAGARIGIGWIGIVALCAVFAPFLANSHPLIMTVDGETSSPLLVHLTWIDVSLLAAFGASPARRPGPRTAPGTRRVRSARPTPVTGWAPTKTARTCCRG